MKTAKIEVDYKSGYGSTALHLAAADNLKTVEILVTHKANIQLANSLGDTPLMRNLNAAERSCSNISRREAAIGQDIQGNILQNRR